MELKRPVLLLDKTKCLTNIHKMKAKADMLNLVFRPHFKTHQSAEVGSWFRKAGISKITVSSVMMAEYFASHGWDDITIAFPVNIAEIEEINSLASIIQLNLLIENHEALQVLSDKITHLTGIFIKLDAGYHRTGVPISDHHRILDLIHKISKNKILNFRGFIIHNGHSYSAKGKSEIQIIHNLAIQHIENLRAFLNFHGVSTFFSIGDTPSMSVLDNFGPVQEIRPGNFVFYDVMQQNIGSCTFDEIAVALAVPVVAKHPERQEMVVYGGAVHLSKESITDDEGNKVFGKVVKLTENGWGAPLADTFVKSLSQELGIIKTTAQVLEQTKIGEFVGILPVHSCLTVTQMREYFTLQGERITTMLLG